MLGIKYYRHISVKQIRRKIMIMPTTVTNSTSTEYQFSGSSEVLTTQSNVHDVILQDPTGITLSKTSNTNSFVVGQIITYTVEITNNSSQFFNGVRIIDNLGGGNLAYVLGSATLTVGSLTYPVTPISTNPLTFTLQELNVGSTMFLRYNCQVIFNLPSSVNNITNTVQGIGYTSTGTITGFATNTISRNSSQELEISKGSTLSSVLPNQVFSYLITITNNTSTSATLNTVTDQLPGNFVITNVSVKVGTNPTINLSESDYVLSSTNNLTIPSPIGPTLTVPSNGETLITITGYLT